jgi:hypothetical protein
MASINSHTPRNRAGFGCGPSEPKEANSRARLERISPESRCSLPRRPLSASCQPGRSHADAYTCRDRGFTRSRELKVPKDERNGRSRLAAAGRTNIGLNRRTKHSRPRFDGQHFARALHHRVPFCNALRDVRRIHDSCRRWSPQIRRAVTNAPCPTNIMSPAHGLDWLSEPCREQQYRFDSERAHDSPP